jgi:hypothetical protein
VTAALGDTGGVTSEVADDVAARPPTPPAPTPTKRKHGRETAADMLRTLAVIMLLVVPMWFLAQPPDSDEQRVRVVDPAGDLAAFQAEVPQAPVPAALPQTWRATSSTLQREPDALRIGYVTPDGEYAEFAASTAERAEYLAEITGEEAAQLDAVQVDGVAWEQYRDADGSLSLVRSYGPAVVVVGSLRSSADLAELRALAASLQLR